MLLGQTIWTQSVGQRTTMVNEQQFELPARSLAQQVTVVLPTGKDDPEGGVQTTESSLQLSSAVGFGYSTIIFVQFGLSTTMLPGQVMIGGIVSGRTVTSKQHH